MTRLHPSFGGAALTTVLASLATAQPVVEYKVVGSLSTEWTDKPWPNAHVNFTEPPPGGGGEPPPNYNYMRMMYIPDVGVTLGNGQHLYLIEGSSIRPLRDDQSTIPGLAPARTWGNAFNEAQVMFSDGQGGFVMNSAYFNAPLFASLHTVPSGYAPCAQTVAANRSGTSMVIVWNGQILNWGVAPTGGAVTQVVNQQGQAGGVPGHPTWIVTQGRLWGIDDHGTVYGTASRQAPSFAEICFTYTPGQASIITRATVNSPAAPVGTLTSFGSFSTAPLVITGAADGSFIMPDASVRRSSDNTVVEGIWHVSPTNQWMLIAPFYTQVRYLPAGVTMRPAPVGNTTVIPLEGMNRDGVYYRTVYLQGPGLFQYTDALLRWSQADGISVVAVYGQPIPGLNGQTYHGFYTLHVSDRGDAAFQDGSGALCIYHPRTGVVPIAQWGQPVANGLATGTPARMLHTIRTPNVNYSPFQPPYSSGSSGHQTWFDDTGRFYFAAVSDPHFVAYSARLQLYCPGDFNHDGFIDFFDADSFVECFSGGQCPGGQTADFNEDGFVDFFDMDAFIAAFEAGC